MFNITGKLKKSINWGTLRKRLRLKEFMEREITLDLVMRYMY